MVLDQKKVMQNKFSISKQVYNTTNPNLVAIFVNFKKVYDSNHRDYFLKFFKILNQSEGFKYCKHEQKPFPK